MRLSIVFFLLIITYLPVHSQSTVTWISRYEVALEQSRIQNKLIILNFWSPTSEVCRRMDIETWSKDTIASLMDGFIPAQINIENDFDIASQFGVKVLPTIVIIDSYGIQLEKVSGPATSTKLNMIQDAPSSITVSAIQRLLTRYPKDISTINAAQNKYADQKNDISVLFEIAEAYLFTSIQAEQSAKTNFITESKTYLNRSKKLLKKTKKTSLKQRFQIIELAQAAFRTKPEKGIEKLLAFQKSNKILPEHLALFNASLYYGYITIKQRRKANTALEALKSAEGADQYLKIFDIS